MEFGVYSFIINNYKIIPMRLSIIFLFVGLLFCVETKAQVDDQTLFEYGVNAGNAACQGYRDMLDECGTISTTFDVGLNQIITIELEGSLCANEVENIFNAEFSAVLARASNPNYPNVAYWQGFLSVLRLCALELGFS